MQTLSCCALLKRAASVHVQERGQSLKTRNQYIVKRYLNRSKLFICWVLFTGQINTHLVPNAVIFFFLPVHKVKKDTPTICGWCQTFGFWQITCEYAQMIPFILWSFSVLTSNLCSLHKCDVGTFQWSRRHLVPNEYAYSYRFWMFRMRGPMWKTLIRQKMLFFFLKHVCKGSFTPQSAGPLCARLMCSFWTTVEFYGTGEEAISGLDPQTTPARSIHG